MNNKPASKTKVTISVGSETFELRRRSSQGGRPNLYRCRGDGFQLLTSSIGQADAESKGFSVEEYNSVAKKYVE
jgi:hypothetical protein